MPVYKSKTPTSDGRCYFYKVNVKDVFGKIKPVVSKKYLTKTEAKLAEREFLNDSDTKQKGKASEDMTFRELLALFKEYKQDKSRRQTKKNYENKDRHIQEFMDVKCVDYSEEQFNKWRDNINAKPISITYKNDILKYWKSILNYGMTWHHFNFMDVYRKMDKFNDPDELKKEMDFYTFEEFNQFLSEEDDIRYRCLWMTLYYCGLRRGEARGLTWSNIDLRDKTLHIIRQVQSDKDSNTGWYFCPPKTNKSCRNLPMADVLVDELKKLKEEMSKAKNFNEEFFAFGGSGGLEPFTPSSVRDRKLKLSEKANLKNIRLHDFRHSCASLLINSGANVTIVSKFLGHADVEETLNTYSHMFKGALDSVVNIVNNLTSNQ